MEANYRRKRNRGNGMRNIILRQYKSDLSWKQTLVLGNKVVLLICILFLVIVKTGIEAVLVLVERLAPKSEKDTQKRKYP
jgi:hypothetical protein